jgi:protein-disulfide isomerase
MALVKVTVTCNHCKVAHEEYDATQYDDREKYLAYWNLPFEGPEADKAWAQKLEMTPKEAPMVMSDIDGYISQVDGSWIKSRSEHRSHLKQHRMIELGNDVPMQHKQADMSTKSKEARKRDIAEQVYQKLSYK